MADEEKTIVRDIRVLGAGDDAPQGKEPYLIVLSGGPVGMMYRYTFGKPEADDWIQEAVNDVLEKYRTPDIMAEGKKRVGCEQMGDLMLEALEQLKPVPTPN